MTETASDPPFLRVGPEQPASPVVISVPHAGRYLIVVDTQRAQRPDWSPSPFLKTSPKRQPASPSGSSRPTQPKAAQGSNTAAPSMALARSAATASLACANG